MHIIFGGAFNGKRKFVRERLAGHEAAWFEGELPDRPAPLAVIAGLEDWARQQLEAGLDERQLTDLVQKAIRYRNEGRLIWILTDFHRGIVPADPLERQLRDVTGRLYQLLFKEAETVTRIWYGLPQRIKGADEDENLHTDRG